MNRHRPIIAVFFAFASLMLPAPHALALDRVVFGTDWLAQAEHGGFYQAVLEELPMEFALEAKALLAVSLEGAVG